MHGPLCLLNFVPRDKKLWKVCIKGKSLDCIANVCTNVNETDINLSVKQTAT